MAANQGVAPADYSTPEGQVRLLLGDTDPTDVTEGKGTYLWYSDAELTALIAMRSGNVKRTAASILRGIAVSQLLLLKKFTSADLAVDGPAISDSMLKAADALSKEADEDDQAIAGGYVNIVPVGGYDMLAAGMRETPLDRAYPQDWRYPVLGVI